MVEFYKKYNKIINIVCPTCFLFNVAVSVFYKEPLNPVFVICSVYTFGSMLYDFINGTETEYSDMFGAVLNVIMFIIMILLTVLSIIRIIFGAIF